MFEIISKSPMDTAAIGDKIGRHLSGGMVICLYGDLGAGKTLFVQNLAKGLDIEEEVTSPTFNLMNVYEGRMPLYHFDLYRLETEEELEEIVFYEYLEEPEGIVVIEWPNKFPESMPDDYVEVSIERTGETGRKLTFSSIGEENKEFLKELETFVNTGH